MMSRRCDIAVLATACRLPDASSPAELWTNVIEGRRSFRAIPPQRLDLDRYAARHVGESDSITAIRAALLTDWTIDRAAFRIPHKTLAATDTTHWLALQLAADVIAAIGGPGRLDCGRTAVVVANTLTGEFSRAALLRLRLPFLDEILADSASRQDIPPEAATRLRGAFADEIRRRFPDPNEDSLAGGLANTIAGRIANYFDLRGGAYLIDGACASSLVALADAANLLRCGQVDAVVVAAVDLSLDPFELVGFSRNGALATSDMRVFDARSNGFWPGEGGAATILMREEDAVCRDLPQLARLRGWGLSTDGAGGLTRPSSEGQLAACRQAYDMAEADPADLAFVEAHGTGTAVGDPIEVRALAGLRQGARAPLPIGSIKANIGHTKAAAGMAGLVKAIEALRHGVVPPHVSCERPHPVFAETDDLVRPALAGEGLPATGGALAGVSSFGFGGVNAHVVIEGLGDGSGGTRARGGVNGYPFRADLPAAAQPSVQDAEIFLFAGEDEDRVIEAIAAFERRAAGLSMAEFVDAAAHACAGAFAAKRAVRVAIVAGNASELAARLTRARTVLGNGGSVTDADGALFIGRPSGVPRVGFLCPGQGAPSRPDGGAWRRRFAAAADLAADLPAVDSARAVDTEVAQPSIVAASLAGLRVLAGLGISAAVATGHSLGEITALAWAGLLDDEAALALARERGAIMARAAKPGGAMLRVAAPPRVAETLARDTGTHVACRNGGSETVLSGDAEAIATAAALCKTRGLAASRLAVSHAFHSPHMRPAAEALADALDKVDFGPGQGVVASTVTGDILAPGCDLRGLLVRQLTAPVQFGAALDQVAARADVLVEIGPGQGLTRLAGNDGATVYAIDAFGDSLQPLLVAAGALFAAGLDIRASALFDDRPVRAFDPAALPILLRSPCGSSGADAIAPAPMTPVVAAAEPVCVCDDPLAVVRSVVARETGVAPEQIGADDRFLDTLHLNSLAVARIVAAAAKALDLRTPSAPTEFANASARVLADALAELRAFPPDARADAGRRIGGVRPWIRTYAMTWTKAAAEPRPTRGVPIRWQRIDVRGSQCPQPPGHAASRPQDDEGQVLWIDDSFDVAAAHSLVGLMADAARGGWRHVALCHGGAPVSAFARSAAAEGRFQTVRVIERGAAGLDDAGLAAVLSTDVERYDEVRVTDGAGMETPVFAPVAPPASPAARITADDVAVVVGGGKGLTAECALALGRRGAAIILVGRSPAADPDVCKVLARAEHGGMRCRYVRADVLHPEALQAALAPAIAAFGAATVLLYAPAVNEPMRLTDLDPDTTRRTLAPKTLGLATTLSVLGPRLRRVVTFGSIIGRIGLEGEAHYALANAMQSAATLAWAAAGHARFALAIEWSVWAGSGMAEKLGTLERLEANGVDALSVDGALDMFDRLIGDGATGAVTVTSRFGPPPDLSLGGAELPVLRFVDRPLVHFPGIEIVVDTALARGRDGCMDDHVVGGRSVLPAVAGLEAMAQVAAALSPLPARISVTDIAFDRAIDVSDFAATRIRIAALRHGDTQTEVQVFAEDDGFAAPCMRAIFGARTKDGPGPARPLRPGASFPAADLYGPLFFAGLRLQRLDRFTAASARQIAVSLSAAGDHSWFGPYEPATTLLWDPGLADSALHALQVAVPHRRVLPVRAERLDIDRSAGPPVRVEAVEVRAGPDGYTFDIVATDGHGHTAFRWTAITFRPVGRIDVGPVLAAAPALAGAYLERVAREALGDDTIEVALSCDSGSDRAARRLQALRTFGVAGGVEHRADGRPLRGDRRGAISLAHVAGVTLAVTARQPVGCDIEPVQPESGGDSRSLDSHVAFEVCRKLGRKPSPATIRELARGHRTTAGDVDMVAVELPLPSGPHLVAIGCLPPVRAASARTDERSSSEVMSWV